MSANDDFPRGPLLTVRNLGASSSVTFPALATLGWVITNVHAIGNSGFLGAYSLDLTANGIALDAFSGNAAAASDAQATVDFTGKLAFPPNIAVTITVTQTGNLNTTLTASAYAI